MRAVLVDTGPLLALTVRQDQFYRRALEERRRLQQENFSVVVGYPTLYETYSLLLRHLKPSAAHRWRQQLTQSLGYLTPTTEDFEAAARKVERYSDQTLSLFDGMVAVLSERLAGPIWTFDADFDVMQADVWR